MTPRLLSLAKKLHGWLEALRLRVQPQMDHWLADWKPDPDRLEADFVRDADYVIKQQEPLRARVLLKSVGIVFAVFVMWAAVAQIDEITRGDGKVIPSQQLQVLQSLDGGIVEEILVREGQIVDAGQILLRVDPTRFESSVRESRAQYLALQAKLARLRALAENKPFEPPEEVLKEDPTTAAEERRYYENAVSSLDAQLSIARQQLTQRQQELAEMRVKRDQASQAYELTAKELAVTKPLIASGAVSEVELLRLERDTTRFRGERDMAAAQIAKSQAAIAEATRKASSLALASRSIFSSLRRV